MATEKILNTRILMKVDTLEAWNSSTLPLKKGELAFATVAASAGTGLTEPVVMVKIGEDGVKTFKDLPWNFYAKSSDILTACKSEEALNAYIKNRLNAEGVATTGGLSDLAERVTTAEGEIDALQAELDTATTGLKARMTTAEGAIDALEVLVGDTAVATQISNAIAELKLGETYAAKSLETTVANHVGDTVAHVTSDDKVKWNNALQSTDIATGTANGTISVKGNDVSIKGLGSAAYTDSTAYDAAGSAAAAQSAAEATAKSYTDTREAAIKTAYEAYADKAEADAITAAKGYTDEREAAIKTAYEAYADQAEADAKAYVDQVTGGQDVSASIEAALASYSTTEQMTSAISTAKGEATKHADDLNTAMNTRVAALEAIDHSHTFNEEELNKIAEGDVAKWNAAEQNAKDYADGLDKVMDERVAALEGMFGDGEGTVEAQIEAAVSAETKAREDADAALQAQIGNASAEGVEATGLHARLEDLEELVGDDKVSEAIANAVKVEEDRAKGVEEGLETRLKAVEDDYLKAADKTELEGKIKSNADAIELLTNGVDSETVDGVNDLIQYVKDHGTEVTGIKADIKTNADDIDALEGRMTTAEGAIATKAAQADLEGAVVRIGTAEGKINTLEGEMDQAQADIDALELKVGDKAVSEQISAVTDGLEDRIEALEAVDHEHSNKELLDTYTQTEANLADAVAKKHEHANKAELDLIVSGDKAKLDAAVQTVTAGTGLTATKTGTDVAIGIDESVLFIFDCGDSSDVE